jgi:hypothetical protein
MPARPSVALVALSVVVVVLAPVAGGAAAGHPPASGNAGVAPAAGGPQPDLQGVDADSVTLRVDLRASGDAAWTLVYRVELATDNETAAFESLQDDVAANPDNYTARVRDRFAATAAAASNATGREMAVRNVTVETELQTVGQTYGIVRYRLEWTNFARVDGDRVVAGDAVAGLFLDADTSLVVVPPDGYGVTSTTPAPDESRDGGGVVWRGPRQFDAGPEVVAAPPGPLSGVGPLVVGGVLLVVALLAAGVYRHRGSDVRGPVGGGSAAEPADTDTVDDGPPEELLSNEERVLRLVRERGGRMKQKEVAEELDWTDAKTSQVVGDLRDEGDLEGFRLGRENVLRLPEETEGPLGDDGE